jgi:D-glycero-alpha-D-manno-heptose 1-phosphate guanylyltransferase
MLHYFSPSVEFLQKSSATRAPPLKMATRVNTPVIILAGGFGTRLKSAVPDAPKPLAPVAGRPFLEIMIRDFYRQGVRKIVLSLFHQAEMILEFVEQGGFPADLEIRCEVEPKPLGTGGATLFAAQTLSGPFLVYNGDTWITNGISRFLPAARCPAIGLAEVPDVSRYGTVLTDEAGRVTAFLEKDGKTAPGQINSGMYLLSRELFSAFPLGTPFSLERDIFPQLVQQGRLGGIPLGSDFIDIGIPDDYRTFCAWTKERPELFEKL